MIYTHIWESKPFLKQLYRMARLADKKSYDWSVNVPEMEKHKFIRFQIRDVIASKGLHVANIISAGFHTSLRNAFAHSEYEFNNTYRYIHLDTFKGDTTWDIENIAFDDWTKRFAYSALLSYHFLNIRHKKRTELIKDFGKDEFLIIHPINERSFRCIKIYYDEEHDNFSFYRRKKY